MLFLVNRLRDFSKSVKSMGNSKSTANVASDLGLKPRIRAGSGFNAEETAKILHKARVVHRLFR